MASIYQHTRDMLFFELDASGDRGADPNAAEDSVDDDIKLQLPTWRERVLAACAEMNVGVDLPSSDCEDRDAWDLLLDCLESRVLWDTDWGLTAVMDATPDNSCRGKKELGIDDDYFIAVAPDPSDEEAERLLGELIVLTTDARSRE